MDALADRLQALGLERDPGELAADLRAFAALLHRHNRRLNLIGPLPPDDIVEQLLVDSLLPAVAAPLEAPLVDVGSGGGLPGVPLALASSARPIYLVEPRLKRATFLRTALRRLGLEGVYVRRCRLEGFEDLAPGELGAMAAKAVFPPPDLVALAARWLAPGGLLYLYLSADTWTDALRGQAAAAGFAVEGEVAHPGMEGRWGVAMRLS